MSYVTNLSDYAPHPRRDTIFSLIEASAPSYGIVDIFCQPTDYRWSRLPAARFWDGEDWLPGSYRVEEIGMIQIDSDRNSPGAYESVFKAGPHGTPTTRTDLRLLFGERELADRAERRGNYWEGTRELAERSERHREVEVTYRGPQGAEMTEFRPVELSERDVDMIIAEHCPTFRPDDPQWRVRIELPARRNSR